MTVWSVGGCGKQKEELESSPVPAQAERPHLGWPPSNGGIEWPTLWLPDFATQLLRASSLCDIQIESHQGKTKPFLLAFFFFLFVLLWSQLLIIVTSQVT